MSTEIAGVGTAEAAWLPWLAAGFRPLDMPDHGQRVVVVAAHPDDEVLGVGGLLRALAPSHPIVAVWATDGEASHPGSSTISPATLAARRRQESAAALSRLGVAPVETHHVGLPDGDVAGHTDQLITALRPVLAPADYVLCTWQGDGHPDHEAVGRAVTAVSPSAGQFPIWMWHWAHPGDPRVPWSQLRRVEGIDVESKRAAIACFTSQTRALGPDSADAAVLPPHVLARFERPFEMVVAA